MSSHKGIVWSVVPERRVTLASLATHLDKAHAAADQAIGRVRDIVAEQRREAAQRFSSDYTPMPASRWDEPPTVGRSAEDHIPMPPSRYDVPTDSEPAGDYTPAPTGRWG